MVMVQKSNRWWRMCTDYIDLNKACPKDPYLLPSIDQLVDGASGHGLLSFMNAYSGYKQIRMHPVDEIKTAFITNKGNFCYRIIPFGIGLDLEVYIDDMVAKSADGEQHCEVLTQYSPLTCQNQILKTRKGYPSSGGHNLKVKTIFPKQPDSCLNQPPLNRSMIDCPPGHSSSSNAKILCWGRPHLKSRHEKRLRSYVPVVLWIS
ncbi:hypothetical protein CR513_04760, partial [Mucuna pruriens]